MRSSILKSAPRIALGALKVILFGTTILCGAMILCGTGVALADAPKAQPAVNAKLDQAAQLVQQALKAEADGKPAERDALLKQTLAIAPDYAPAHWQLGELKSGNAWTSIDDAAKHDAHSAKLDEYRQMRDRAAATVDDQLNLARWCEKAGLKEQQRAHLMFVLQLQPNNKEAIAKLGLVRYLGQLVSKDQLDEVKAQLKQSFAESKEWKTKVAGWRKQLQEHPDASHEEILKQIRDIRDPAAISSLEFAFGNSSSEFGNAVVGCLSAMPQQAATESLVRFALLSPDNNVAKGAAYALRSRSMYGYVPLLISALRAPIHVQVDVEPGRFDSISATQMVLYQEGPTADTRIGVNTDNFLGHTFRIVKEDPVVSLRKEAAVADAVEHVNEHASEYNTILASVLETATGQQLGDDPSAWWNWWYDENEFYEPPQKPVVDSTLNLGRRMDCFVAGTPVWTMSGPMQIEKIKVGELVLAENIETGELAYKPVVDMFVRPSGPIIEIHLGEQVIRCAKGHPFWVDGIGWQMAKELKAGQWLHTVHGPMKIDSAKPSDEAVCFNLAVADFHDYFVSSEKLLVHDNLLRGPTLATVPGLAEEK